MPVRQTESRVAIPNDIYEKVFELATELAVASESEDNRSYWAYYNTLKDYCERKRADGFDHPFLWETIADFTTDDKIAIDLYLHALEVKCDDNAPYLASIS